MFIYEQMNKENTRLYTFMYVWGMHIHTFTHSHNGLIFKMTSNLDICNKISGVENFMLNEINQGQKQILHFSLIYASQCYSE